MPLVEQELLTPKEHLISLPVFSWVRDALFSFICMFCRSLFVLLYFFFWPLCCLFFCDIRLQILVSSNSSHITIFECLIDTVFVDERVFQSTVDTPKGTNCAPLHIDFFVYLHEITSQQKQKHLVRSFNFTFLYIYYSISLNIANMIMLIPSINLNRT